MGLLSIRLLWCYFQGWGSETRSWLRWLVTRLWYCGHEGCLKWHKQRLILNVDQSVWQVSAVVAIESCVQLILWYVFSDIKNKLVGAPLRPWKYSEIGFVEFIAKKNQVCHCADWNNWRNFTKLGNYDRRSWTYCSNNIFIAFY